MKSVCVVAAYTVCMLMLLRFERLQYENLHKTCVKHLNCKLYYRQLHLKYWCNLARYRLQAVWGWHDSVETCSGVIICEIIVHLLVIVKNNIRCTVCMYIGFKTSFYVVRHLDSTAFYLPTGLHVGFFRSWPSLCLPSSFSSVFLVLSFVSASTSMLFWVIFLLPFFEHGRIM